MVLSTILFLLVSFIFWIATTLLSQFLVVFGITLIWRAYKTVLVRKVGFLRRRNLKPVEARQAVLITGASSGIGLAVAKHLYKVGYSIIATYYDPKDPGMAELRQLAQQKVDSPTGSKKLFLHQLDVTKDDQVRHLKEEVTKQLNEHKLVLYGLINNAGLGSLQQFAWLQRKNIANLINTNIYGALMMTREFLPLLAKNKADGDNGGARLLFLSSGLAFIPGATYATYGITKSAHLYFSRCMNLELKERYGIQSVAVIPHNFIKNTNICSLNVQNNKSAWEELDPLERSLYAQEYEQQLELTRSLERATKETIAKSSIQGEEQASKRRQATGPVASEENLLLSACKSVVALFKDIIQCLQGLNKFATFEESGALVCFEDALRLRDPPEQIFAGDTTFQLTIGTLLLSLPQSCIGLLSSSVAPSLYK